MGGRTALVLGGGGVLGAAWMAGALAALRTRVSFPLGQADIVVGTSAGSVLAAALRLGMTADQIADVSGKPANALRGKALRLPRQPLG